jgi:hypothetical protein
VTAALEGRAYTVSPEVVRRCAEFAIAGKNPLYSARNPSSNKTKIQTDVFVGKVGEWAAFYHCCAVLGVGVVREPDHAIYRGRQRSWLCDLAPAVEGEQWGVHVKTQTASSAEQYGVSWVFQSTDKCVFGAQRHTDDLVCFVGVTDVEAFDGEGAPLATLPPVECSVRALLRMSELHERRLFAATKIYPLTMKAAIYERALVGVPQVGEMREAA